MPKLALSVMLTMLLASCGSSYPVAAPVSPCKVSPPPGELEVTPTACGTQVCWSIEDTIKLARWAAAVAEYERDVKACPYLVTR